MDLGWALRGSWEGIAWIWDDHCEDLGRALRGRSPVYCNKMHFFCIFLQYYLHMSEKSSTFVADLGIVPAVTI